MLGIRIALLVALSVSMGMAEEVKRNIDMEAAAADGLTLEEFDRLEREADEFEGLSEQDPELFEGDIIPMAFRNANSAKNIWPGGVVPYVFSSNVDRSSQGKIKNALAALMKKVNTGGRCLTIRPKTSRDKNYISISKSGGCSSNVGRQGRGAQTLTLGTGCYSTGTIQHEFLHALGFWHEQSRSDRDKYVTILWDNITAKNKFNFNVLRTDNQGLGYDYGSVMHYGAKAFSKNGKNTILVKKAGARIGQRNGVSAQDVKEVRKLYKC